MIKRTSATKGKTQVPSSESFSVLPQRKQKQIPEKILRSGKEFGAYFSSQRKNDIVPKVELPCKTNNLKKKEGIA